MSSSLLLHLIVTVIRLARPGGLRSIVAESVLVKHQLLILIRGRTRAPNLSAAERFIRRFVRPFPEPSPRFALCNRLEAFHSARSPQHAGATKIPLVVFVQAQASAWPERTE
jgi:hypothetical protein